MPLILPQNIYLYFMNNICYECFDSNILKYHDSIYLYSHMIEIDHRCQAMIDISLKLSTITNSSLNFSNKLSVDFTFMTLDNQNIALPYQVLKKVQKLQQSSSITLQTYRTPEYIVHPKKSVNVDQICIFRLLISLHDIYENILICEVRLMNDNEVIAEKKIELTEILGLNAYLPIFFTWYSISIQSSVQTQLQGIKHKRNSYIPRSLFYKIIDSLVDQNNRLNKKFQQIEDNIKQEQCSIMPITSSLNCSKNSASDIPSFPQYQTQKLGNYQTIFHRDAQKDKQKIFSLQSFCHQAGSYLQIKWKQYISKQMNDMQLRNNINRDKYYSQLKYQFNRMAKMPVNVMQEEQELVQLKVASVIYNLGFAVRKKQVLVSGKNALDDSLGFKSNHVVVLVHGLGANSNAMILYEKILAYLYPQLVILKSRANQQIDNQKTLQQMGKSLSAQIEMYLNGKSMQDLQISFIAHSLGGLVVRSALMHLEAYKFNFNAFISLSCPHFGHLRHSNYITKIGMIAVNKLWHYSIIQNLLFKDSSQLRGCYLYNLGFHPGMSWFQNIYLYGSIEDGFVSACSALLECPPLKHIQNMSTSQKVLNQMQLFFQENLKTTKVEKYEIKFEQDWKKQQKIYERVLGRGPHLQFLTNQSFIEYVLINSSKSFVNFEHDHHME